MPASSPSVKKKTKLTITCLPEATYEKLADCYPKAAVGWKDTQRALKREVMQCIRIYCKRKGIPQNDTAMSSCKDCLQLTFGETLFRKHVNGLSTDTYKYVQSISYCYVSKIFSNLWSSFKRKSLIELKKKEKPKRKKNSNVEVSNIEGVPSSIQATAIQPSTSSPTREHVRANNGQFSSLQNYVAEDEQVVFLTLVKDWIKKPDTRATQPSADAINLLDMESDGADLYSDNGQSDAEEAQQL